MLVTGSASDYITDDQLISRQQHITKDRENLKDKKTIVTASNNKVLTTTTGTIRRFVIDEARRSVALRISSILVSGVGCSLLSSPETLKPKVCSTIESSS